MHLLRLCWSTTCVAALLGCVLVLPAPAGAQAFVELAGGWNYVAPVASVASSNGSNVRASIGWQVAPSFRWRIDAFTSQFDAKTALSLPCPSSGCPASAYIQSERVNGLTANGLVEVDPRGIFYLIGGAGLYDLQSQTPETWHLGVSAGAGIAVPVATHLRAVVEARWHGVLGATSGPAWLVPITIGFRY
jgi:hypothetical protein